MSGVPLQPRVPGHYAGWTAAEIKTDIECREAGDAMLLQDGLLDPALDDIFARLSTKGTRRIGDHNLNF